MRELAGQSSHDESDHIIVVGPGIVVVELDDGTLVRCGDTAREDDLTPIELLHCNAAMEQDKNDSEGYRPESWPMMIGKGGDDAGEGDGSGEGGSDGANGDGDEGVQGSGSSGSSGGGGSDKKAASSSSSSSMASSSSSSSMASSSSSSSSDAPSSSPRRTPSASPSHHAPTSSPSYHPTYRRDPQVIRGTVYYDRNANGERDSNVDDPVLGRDVEYSYGLGGVTVQLMECDPSTNEGLGAAVLVDKYGKGENSYATTMSTGYDVKMHPKMVGRQEGGGLYNLIDIKVDRAYYIYLRAPEGYLLTGGVCNDDVRGWECTYNNDGGLALAAEGKRSGGRRALTTLRGGGPGNNGPPGGGTDNDRDHRRGLQGTAIPVDDARQRQPEMMAPPSFDPPSDKELELGIREGRSSACVSVDRSGIPESHLDVGVMRVGDVSFDETDVELGLELGDDVEMPGLGRRFLLDRAAGGGDRSLRQGGVGMYASALRQEDKDAIGAVTSEILAINLDASLKKKGAVLDSVSYIDVSYYAPEPKVNKEEDQGARGNITDASASAETPPIRDTSNMRPPSNVAQRSRGGGKLSMSLLVRGHYNRNLNVDFDSIVQDSINRITIRRELTYYNTNCRNQTNKVVNLGFTINDFVDVHTNRGVEKPANRLAKRQQEMEEAAGSREERESFSTACDRKKLLPDFFESSLGGMDFRAKTASKTGGTSVESGGASNWAIVLGMMAVGAFALGLGCFLFRRGMKKKQEKLKEARVTHVVVAEHGSMDEDYLVKEKIRQFRGAREGGRALLQPSNSGLSSRGLAGAVQREIGNMTVALGSERRRISSRDVTREESVQYVVSRSISRAPRAMSRADTSETGDGDDDAVIQPDSTVGEDSPSRNSPSLIAPTDFEGEEESSDDSSSDEDDGDDDNNSGGDFEGPRRRLSDMVRAKESTRRRALMQDNDATGAPSPRPALVERVAEPAPNLSRLARRQANQRFNALMNHGRPSSNEERGMDRRAAGMQPQGGGNRSFHSSGSGVSRQGVASARTDSGRRFSDLV